LYFFVKYCKMCLLTLTGQNLLAHEDTYMTQPPIPFEQPPVAAAEAVSSPEVSIVPFSAGDLHTLYGALTNPPDLRFQVGTVELRRDGRSTDMLTTLYRAGLENWHVAEGRMPADSPDDLLVYRIAQLYGLRLASDRHYALTKQRLQPTNPGAIEAAVAAVQESYDVGPMPEPVKPWELKPWEREKWREIFHTDSAFISVALGFAYGQLMEHYQSLFAGEPQVPDSRIYNALHMGMLDSVIFFNTYLRAINGLPKQIFEGMKVYEPAPEAYPWTDEAAIGQVVFDPFERAQPLRLGPGERIEDFFARHEVRRMDIIEGKAVILSGRLIQVGPDEFRRVYEIEEAVDVDLLGESPDSFVLNSIKLAAGAGFIGSMSGAVAGGILAEVANSGEATADQIFDGMAHGNYAGLALGLLAAGVVVARRLKRPGIRL
jgi:hypothetical protein